MLLGLFTFGATPVSTRQGCGIRTRSGQPIVRTLTKIDGEILNILMKRSDRFLGTSKRKEYLVYLNFYVTPFPFISF